MVRHIKDETNPTARELRVGGERQTDGYTRLSSIVLPITSGRIFKYRRVLILGPKMLDCKSEQRFNIKFLAKLKKSATETFQFQKQKLRRSSKGLTEHDLLNCFEYWQHRMRLCVNSEGNYFEGDRS